MEIIFACKGGMMLVIGNWKAFLTTSQASSFFSRHRDDFLTLAEQGASLVVCPSYLALPSVLAVARQVGVAVGAQHCGAVEQGAFTGFVTAQDLADIGCDYSLVGHSEQRLYSGEADDSVARKTASLHKLGIKPVVCIGESLKEREQGRFWDVLAKQLHAVFASMQEAQGVLCIAYEPIWSIGTGVIPTSEQLHEVFSWLRAQAQQQLPNMQVFLLYGGSVSAKNAAELAKIDKIDGFLVGKASLDFQEFKKIVDCTLR